MTNEEAVVIVCELGRQIEKELMEAEAEAEIRRWKPMPNGGHDPECMRALREASVEWGCLPEVLPGDKPGNGKDGAK